LTRIGSEFSFTASVADSLFFDQRGTNLVDMFL